MLIFFLIISLLFSNIAYASFPIVETLQETNIQGIVENQNPGGSLFAILSILLSLLSIVFVFLFIGNGFAHNGNPYPYLLLSIASIAATIFSGMEAKRRGLKKLNPFVGIIITVISLVLIRYLFFV